MNSKKIADEAKGVLSFGARIFIFFKNFFNKTIFNCKLFLKRQAVKEATLFAKSRYPLSFKPFLVAQGLLVVLLLAVSVSFFIPQHNKLNQTAIIKSSTIKQTSTIVANGNPVEWTALVKRSDITSGQYLLKLPKNAKNIKIQTITSQQADTILQSKLKEQLSLKQRNAIAKANQPKSLLLASMLDGISKFFLSSIDNGVQAIIDAVSPDITVTPDATIIDLSKHELKDQEKQQKKETKEEAPVLPEEPATPEITSPATDVEVRNDGDVDLSLREDPQGDEAISQPVETPEIETPTESGATSDVTPTSNEMPSEELVETLVPAPDIEETSPVDQEPVAAEETPDEYVQINYETPAPTISEQNTDTGKLVTVSSSDEENINCESLNPNKKENIVSYIFKNSAASLSGAVSNMFSALSKFFTADLEQAVSDVIDTIVSPAEIPTENGGTSDVPQTPSEASAPVEITTESTELTETPPAEAPAEQTPAVEEIPAENSGTSDVPQTPSEASAPVEITTESTELTETPPAEAPAEQTPAVEEIPAENSGTSDVPQTPSEIPNPRRSGAGTPAAEGDLGAPATTETPTNYPLPTTNSQDFAYQECLAQQVPLTDVLAFTNIPEIYKVGQENKIKIKWKNNNDQNVAFHAYDTDNNGKLDYVEWTVPHLSEQIFEIIFISKAFKLDQNREIIEDIYDQVSAQDNIWATIENNYYVRVTFQQILINQNDITLYARPINPGESVRVEVYPENSDQLITTFNNIDQEKTYKVYLTNLQTPTDVFDLKIIGALDIDYIVDPAPPSGAPSVTEPVNSSSIGNLQTIIGTPDATTQSTSTLFNYLRKLEEDRLSTTAGAESENATDAGKLEDLLGTSAVADDRITIFDYIHKIYTALVNLVEGNIKSGIEIGGLTGTYSGTPGYPATGQTIATYGTSRTCGDGGTGTCEDGYYKSGSVLDSTIYSNVEVGSQYVAVNDSSTGLMWQKCSAGLSDTNKADTCATGAATTLAWKTSGLVTEAINYCENLELCNDGTFQGDKTTEGDCSAHSGALYINWRLPNIKELFSIVSEDAGQSAPRINKTFFPGTVSNRYWSSTTYPAYTNSAFYGHFQNGFTATNNKANTYYVRCVRGQ